MTPVPSEKRRRARDPTTWAHGSTRGATALRAPMTVQRRNVVFLAVVLGMLLAALDQTIVATALPTVVSDLGGAGHQSWVVTSYLLASTIVTAVVGKLGDTFGRKMVFQAAILVFLAGSVLCGLAGVNEHAGGCAGSAGHRWWRDHGHRRRSHRRGDSPAGTRPLPGCTRRGLRRHHRRRAVARRAVHRSPLLALGVLDQRAGRRVVVLVAAAWALPEARAAPLDRPSTSRASSRRSRCRGLTLATSWGGTTYPWGSATIIGLFADRSLIIWAFVFDEPAPPSRSCRSDCSATRCFTVCCVLSFVVGFAMLGALTFLPDLYAVRRRGLGDGLRAAHACRWWSGLLVDLVDQRCYRRTHRALQDLPGRGHRDHGRRIRAVVADGFQHLGVVQSLYLLVLGAGIGLSMQVLVLIVQNTVDFTDLGVATSGVTFFRTIGSSFGAAIFGSMFSNFLTDRLPAALAASGALPAAAQLAAGAASPPPHRSPRRSSTPTPIR